MLWSTALRSLVYDKRALKISKLSITEIRDYMLNLTYHGIIRDLRTKTYVLYAQASITDYLKLVGSDFDTFEIQRNRQKHRFYQRMKNDIQSGALLPAITLAVR